MTLLPEFSRIHNRAIEAANAAAADRNAALGPEKNRGLDCGFAWVQITPGSHEYARFLKAQGIGKKHWDKGWYLWASSELHNVATQSVSVHEAAARAYAKTVQEGLRRLTVAPDISVGSRLD